MGIGLLLDPQAPQTMPDPRGYSISNKSKTVFSISVKSDTVLSKKFVKRTFVNNNKIDDLIVRVIKIGLFSYFYKCSTIL